LPADLEVGDTAGFETCATAGLNISGQKRNAKITSFHGRQYPIGSDALRMTLRLLIVLLIYCWRCILAGAPADDLNSPRQEVRDAAAKILRSSYTTPSRTNWDAVVNSITNGMTKTNLLKLLSPYHVTEMWGGGSGGTYSQAYRLDDAWILICSFRNAGDILFDRKLSMDLRNVWVLPPTNFSGIWIVYFVNGQKSHQIHYDAGKYHGEFIAYNSDGTKSYVQHYDHHVAEGADTGYFTSGRTNYHGIYKRDKQVGIWTWYNEDGSVRSTEDYSKR